MDQFSGAALLMNQDHNGYGLIGHQYMTDMHTLLHNLIRSA